MRENVSVERFNSRDKSRKGKKLMVTCPVCNEEMQRKGLHGHLRFKHGLTGDKLDKTYNDNVEAGEKQQKQQEHQAMVDRISKLHDELRNVRAKLEEVKAEDRSSFFASDEAADKLRKLYESEEKRIKADLDKLLQEAGVKDEGWF